MRSSVYITSNAFAILLVLAIPCLAQRVAVIAPENAAGMRFAEHLADELTSAGITVSDSSASVAAYRSIAPETPFNMTSRQAASVGEVLGTDVFVLVRAVTQPRTSLGKGTYFEASAAIFVIGSRSGKLLRFRLERHEAETAAAAEKALYGARFASHLADDIRGGYADDLQEKERPATEEVPAEGSPAARGLRTPIPYRRIKPDYTRDAFLFGVAATVDAEADIDADGIVGRVAIVRWAGYGLDEAAEAAIRAMNWRPAERDGKKLPMRILLRYNFTKIEKEEQ